jgi:hypothetical protein
VRSFLFSELFVYAHHIAAIFGSGVVQGGTAMLPVKREFSRVCGASNMKTYLKSALAALALAGAAWAAPANAQGYDPNYPPPASAYGGYDGSQPYDPAYGPQGNYYPPDNGNYPPPDYADGYGYYPPGGVTFSYDSGGYCDQWGCPDAFWDLPVYYGPVFFGGAWYDGPLYYRDWYGQRQYWLHGGWHFDEWRGPRPSWWHAGRIGPALGMNFYMDHGFHGRWDSDRRGFGGGFVNRGTDNRGFDRGGFATGGFEGRRDFGQRGNFQAPRNNQAPQENRGGFRGAPANPPAANFQGRPDGRGWGHYQRPEQQARNNGAQNNGGHDRGGHDGHGGGGRDHH